MLTLISELCIRSSAFAKSLRIAYKMSVQHLLYNYTIFEPTCAHARWALMRRLASVRLSVQASY